MKWRAKIDCPRPKVAMMIWVQALIFPPECELSHSCSTCFDARHAWHKHAGSQITPGIRYLKLPWPPVSHTRPAPGGSTTIQHCRGIPVLLSAGAAITTRAVAGTSLLQPSTGVHATVKLCCEHLGRKANRADTSLARRLDTAWYSSAGDLAAMSQVRTLFALVCWDPFALPQRPGPLSILLCCA